MPELPEVETVKRAIATTAFGHKLGEVWTSGKAMRWAIPDDIDQQLSGLVIMGVRRRGKYIILDLGNIVKQAPLKEDKSVIIHLGMSGSIRIYPEHHALVAMQHDHMVIKTTSHNGGVRIVLNDPRRFGGVQVVMANTDGNHPLLRGMGVEPLGNNFNGDLMKTAFAQKSSPIKSALLDQKIIAGIGNIYASEALFLAEISPKRLAKNIGLRKLDTLAGAIRKVLEKAIDAGGTSLRDHVQPGGEIGYFAQQLNVYGRLDAPCPKCTKPIKMIRQAGRASFYCSACQR